MPSFQKVFNKFRSSKQSSTARSDADNPSGTSATLTHAPHASSSVHTAVTQMASPDLPAHTSEAVDQTQPASRSSSIRESVAARLNASTTKRSGPYTSAANIPIKPIKTYPSGPEASTDAAEKKKAIVQNHLAKMRKLQPLPLELEVGKRERAVGRSNLTAREKAMASPVKGKSASAWSGVSAR